METAAPALFYTVPSTLPTAAVEFIDPLNGVDIESSYQLIAPSEKRGPNVRSHYWKMLPDEEKKAEKRRRKEMANVQDGIPLSQLPKNHIVRKRLEKLPPTLAARLCQLFQQNPTMFQGSILDDDAAESYNVGQDFDSEESVPWDEELDELSVSHSTTNPAQANPVIINEGRLLSWVGLNPIVILRSYGHCCKKWQGGELDGCPKFIGAEDDKKRCDTCGCLRNFHKITDKYEDGRPIETITIQGPIPPGLFDGASTSSPVPHTPIEEPKQRTKKRKVTKTPIPKKKPKDKPTTKRTNERIVERGHRGRKTSKTTVPPQTCGSGRKRLVSYSEKLELNLQPEQTKLLEELKSLVGTRYSKPVLRKVRLVLGKLAVAGERDVDQMKCAVKLENWIDARLNDPIFSEEEEEESIFVSKKTRTRIHQCIRSLFGQETDSLADSLDIDPMGQDHNVLRQESTELAEALHDSEYPLVDIGDAPEEHEEGCNEANAKLLDPLSCPVNENITDFTEAATSRGGLLLEPKEEIVVVDDDTPVPRCHLVKTRVKIKQELTEPVVVKRKRGRPRKKPRVSNQADRTAFVIL